MATCRRDPGAPLDQSCVSVAEAAERPALFTPPSEATSTLFGTASAYD